MPWRVTEAIGRSGDIVTLMVQRSEGVSILGEGLESEEPMGIIWWRNPSERAQDAVFSVASVLELPQETPRPAAEGTESEGGRERRREGAARRV